MKKTITTILLILNLLMLFPTTLVGTVNADEFEFRETLGDFQSGVEEQSGEVQEGADEIVLPDYQESGEDGGARGIVNAIQNFLDFFKLLVTPIAILFIIVMGLKIMSAGSDNEDAINKAKNYIRYAAEGLVVIFVADAIVEVFFGPEGEILREGEAGAREFGRRTAELFEGLYALLQVLIGAIAVLVIIISGMRFIGGSYSEDQVNSAKRHITWALVGLFVVAVSEFVAKDILFQNRGQTLGIDNAKQLFAQVTNFVAGTIGTLSFMFGLYSGYLYVTAREAEDQTEKAKKILWGAVLGVLLAAAAFAITNTLVDLDATR